MFNSFCLLSIWSYTHRWILYLGTKTAVFNSFCTADNVGDWFLDFFFFWFGTIIHSFIPSFIQHTCLLFCVLYVCAGTLITVGARKGQIADIRVSFSTAAQLLTWDSNFHSIWSFLFWIDWLTSEVDRLS